MTKPSKKILVIIIVLLIFVMAAILYVWLNRNENSSPAQNNSGINYAPPTEQESQAGNDIKESQPNGNAGTSSPGADESSDLKNTEVVITDASQYENIIEVRAFMPSVVQQGECTLTFKKGGEIIEFKEPAYPDASSTICVSQNINRADFSQSGKWDVTVSYLSINYTGSASATLEVNE